MASGEAHPHSPVIAVFDTFFMHSRGIRCIVLARFSREKFYEV
jgi:hypothetical protein